VRFSILLPTRNRTDLLMQAIESVQRQQFADWELIVSDNDSLEDVAGRVLALGDRRIRAVRTRQFLPVTENWNHALAQASGDYVIMLGDDDCLLPGALGRVAGLVERHAAPDLVYVQAVQFAYPGVIPDHPHGFVQVGYCEFMKGARDPFLLAREAARRAVERSLAMRLAYSFNMQHSFVRRAAIQRLADRGPFYQSPYPDYYATTVMLLTSQSVLVDPEPLVGIGISPKSFGYYHFNARPEEGAALLNNLDMAPIPEAARKAVLPGNGLLTCWFLAMAMVEHNFGADYGVRADADRYRYLQVSPLHAWPGAAAFLRQWARLGPAESAARARDIGSGCLLPKTRSRASIPEGETCLMRTSGNCSKTGAG
jgi:glycosyltransferase involved in cell wall biosynthesis